MRRIVLFALACLAVLACAVAPPDAVANRTGQGNARRLLNMELRDGEAILWYLGHAGWVIRTRNQLLIFDYWPLYDPPAEPSLANGYIDPREIAGRRVTVFVTHSHGDHFDRVIFEWKEHIPDIRYVFGWEASNDPEHICLSAERAVRDIDGIEVSTINHSFDKIPEAAFLVRADGLVIFHSGDHGSTGDEINPVFRDNIDYLADRTKAVDIALLSIFGSRRGEVVNRGDLYTIERLKPKVTFPMHRGHDPRSYEEWARAVAGLGIATAVRYAMEQGDWFVYRNGTVVESSR